jgi:tellurite resistance protein TehA-like permease
LLLSKQFSTLVSATGIMDGELYGKVAIVMGTSVALSLWAIGLWFGVISTLGLVEICSRTSIPFRVNFWGMVFPTYCVFLCTIDSY